MIMMSPSFYLYSVLYVFTSKYIVHRLRSKYDGIRSQCSPRGDSKSVFSSSS